MVGSHEGDPPPGPDSGRGRGRGRGVNSGSRRAAFQSDKSGGVSETFGPRRTGVQTNENVGGEIFGPRRTGAQFNENDGGEDFGLRQTGAQINENNGGAATAEYSVRNIANSSIQSEETVSCTHIDSSAATVEPKYQESSPAATPYTGEALTDSPGQQENEESTQFIAKPSSFSADLERFNTTKRWDDPDEFDLSETNVNAASLNKDQPESSQQEELDATPAEEQGEGDSTDDLYNLNDQSESTCKIILIWGNQLRRVAAQALFDQLEILPGFYEMRIDDDDWKYSLVLFTDHDSAMTVIENWEESWMAKKGLKVKLYIPKEVRGPTGDEPLQLIGMLREERDSQDFMTSTGLRFVITSNRKISC